MAVLKPNVSKKTQTLVLLAFFSAIIILMGFTPLGFLKVGVIEITFIVIPVAIGAIMLGPIGGAILGAVFGFVSFFQCFGLSPFGVILFGINPIKTFILCVIPRILVGWLTGLIFVLLAKSIRRGGKTVACAAAALSCPIINTITFVGLFVLFFGSNPEVHDLFGTTAIWGIIVTIISANAVIEAIVTFVVAAAIARVLVHVLPGYEKETSA